MAKQYQEALRWEQACKAGGVCPPDIKALLSRDEVRRVRAPSGFPLTDQSHAGHAL